MPLADTWAVVAGISGAGAVAAALVIVVLAAATLREARRSRDAGAVQQRELLGAQERAAAAAEAAHRVELEVMEKAHAFELRLAQDRALETVADLIREIADTSRREAANGVPMIGDVQPMGASAIPVLLLRLQTGLASCDALNARTCPRRRTGRSAIRAELRAGGVPRAGDERAAAARGGQAGRPSPEVGVGAAAR